VACNHRGFSRPEDGYKEAKLAFERGELVRALQLASEGTAKYRADLSWGPRFQVLEAEILVWQGKSNDSLSLLNDPLPQASTNDAVIRRDIIRAIAYYRRQEFGKSASVLSEAEQLAKSKAPELLADVSMVRGTLALNVGDYKQSREFYESALLMARQQNRLFLQTSILGNLGVLALRQQRCGEAIDWFTETQAGADKLQNQTIAEKILLNLGWCYYTLGDYERALDNYNQALATSTKLGALQDQLVSLNNIGLVYDIQSDYGQALAYYRKSLDIARSLGDRSASIIALNNLAYSSLTTGKLDEADQYNQESIRLQKESGDNSWRNGSILNTARIAFGRKQYPEATKLFREVIDEAGNNESLRWEAESDLAALYAAEGNDVVADLQYKKGLETIDRARASLTKDEHRLSFLNTASRFYNDYIDFLVAHHREREALAVAEHSRARTLAEGLKIPVQLRESAFHPEENARRLNSVVLSYWLKPERSYLWVVTPKRVQLFPLPPQSEIDAAVEEYRKALLGPSQARDSGAGEKLYQILVAPAEKLIRTATRHPEPPCPTSVAVNRRGHHEPLGAPHLPSSGRCGSAPRVIVIPDGSLVNLNFETLMVPTPQPHYWIEDATISNASSIALLGASTNRAIAPSGHRAIENNGTMPFNGTMARSPDGTIPHGLLLIGAPDYAGTGFPELSQARNEVQEVERYFPTDQRTVIEGKAAVPSAYDEARPGRFTYIHFVAHGTASRLSPLDSSVVLSKQGDTYKLYARDIMQQPLRADLVTISACYGAGSRSYQGEGLVGLSWAFLRAGAHNVIAALWEVNDASTPQLMNNLYLNIHNGEDPATALRNAKLDMLHSQSVYRRPFYWGAFQLYVGS
jgi:CHAT domain-containing protein